MSIRHSWMYGMKILLIMAFILKTSVGNSTSKDKLSFRIIGGSSVRHKYFPYLVSIQTFHHRWSHSCGGSIINSYVILTACHCLYLQRYPLRLRHPYYTKVVAGITQLDRHTQYSQVSRAQRFHTHPNCGRPNNHTAENYHDNGIIVLETPLVYTAEVQPLKVFSKNPQVAFSELLRLQQQEATCYIPGWGLTGSDPDIVTNQLKVASKRLITSRRCQSFLCPYRDYFCLDFDKFDQVCAVGRHSSVCNGDSGGPLVCNGFVFGTVSYGPGCGVNIPQVFSSIKPILYYVNFYDGYRRRKKENIRKSTKNKKAPKTKTTKITKKALKKGTKTK